MMTFVCRSADAGDPFEPTLNLSNNATGSVDPTVTARGNNVYVAWSDLPAGVTKATSLDIYLTTSVDSGVSFDPASAKKRLRNYRCSLARSKSRRHRCSVVCLLGRVAADGMVPVPNEISSFHPWSFPSPFHRPRCLV